MKIPLINLNHKNHNNAFFFNALYSAVIFAVVLIFNDYVDKFLDKKKEFKDHHKKSIKVFIHFITTFILTLGLIYLFWVIFGWGNTLLG